MVNANNWHWIERNCLPWAVKHLSRRLTSITADGFTITQVVSVTGQADINQRKGRLITVFDLAITVQWKGPSVTGQLVIPEFMHDTELDKLEMQIVLDGGKSSGDTVKQVEKCLGNKIRDILRTFSPAMIHENSKDLLQEGEPSPPRAASNVPNESVANIFAATPSASVGASVGKTASIEVESQFLCDPSHFYDILVNEEKVRIWTRDAKATVGSSENSKFSLFGGNVSGRWVELDASKISMTWQLQSWSKHSSFVTISIDSIQGGTHISLKQTGVPIDDVDVVTRNWEVYYFEPIRSHMKTFVGLPLLAPITVNGKKTATEVVGDTTWYMKAAAVVLVVAITLFFSVKPN